MEQPPSDPAASAPEASAVTANHMTELQQIEQSVAQCACPASIITTTQLDTSTVYQWYLLDKYRPEWNGEPCRVGEVTHTVYPSGKHKVQVRARLERFQLVSLACDRSGPHYITRDVNYRTECSTPIAHYEELLPEGYTNSTFKRLGR